MVAQLGQIEVLNLPGPPDLGQRRARGPLKEVFMPEVSAPSASADGEMKIQAAKEKDTAAAAQEGGSSTSSPSTAGTHSSSPNGLDEQGSSKPSAATSQGHTE